MRVSDKESIVNSEDRAYRLRNRWDQVSREYSSLVILDDDGVASCGAKRSGRGANVIGRYPGDPGGGTTRIRGGYQED